MGCSGVMRVAPVGWMACWSPEQCFEIGVRTAALTHGHRNGWAPAGALAMMIRLLLDDRFIDHAIETIIDRLRNPEQEETRLLLEDAVELASSKHVSVSRLNQILGEDWVGHEALAIAVYSLLRGHTYEDVIRVAANHDGDSGSTASIAGQLWGVTYGLEGLPNAWVRRIDVWGGTMKLFSQYAAS
jgi:ADP-ribosyl-[dinitrogen reductase] hydrolase